MTEIAASVRQGISQACQRAGAGNLADCVATVTSRMLHQVGRACAYRTSEQPISVLACVEKLVSSFWLNPQDLKKRLPPPMKYAADDILGPNPLEAFDNTTHRSLVTFVRQEAQIYVRDGAIPPEARCMNPYEWKIFARMNLDRQRFGSSPLQVDCDLVSVARAHSQDISTHKPQWKTAQGDDPHLGSNGSTPHARITAGTSSRFYQTAENTWRSGTMYSLSSSEQCQAELMNSPGHRRNILDPNLTHAGIGIYVHPDDGQVFVTQAFGGMLGGVQASQRAGSR